MNLASAGLEDGLHTVPEGLEGLGDIGLGHLGPLLVDGSLQLVHIAVADGTGLPLNVPPDGEVQEVEVRALRCPV